MNRMLGRLGVAFWFAQVAPGKASSRARPRVADSVRMGVLRSCAFERGGGGAAVGPAGDRRLRLSSQRPWEGCTGALTAKPQAVDQGTPPASPTGSPLQGRRVGGIGSMTRRLSGTPAE